jgi:hypothetical protein
MLMDPSSWTGENSGRMCRAELERQLRNVLLINMAKNAIELLKPYFEMKAKKVMLEKKRFTQSATAAVHDPTAAARETLHAAETAASTVVHRAISLEHSVVGAVHDPNKAVSDASTNVLNVVAHHDPSNAISHDRAYMADFVDAACGQPEYGGFEVDGTFEDFTEVLIMYGYAVLFAAVYPLAPLLCALLFIVELRVDSFKLFNIVQRPFPKRAASIGAWKSILTTLSWLGAFSNALLLTYTFGVFKGLEFQEQPIPDVFALFAFVVIIVSCKMLVGVLVPDEPESVTTALRRHAYLIRQLLGFSNSQAKLMQGKEGKLGVKLTIDAPDSGQLREPSEFGMLKGNSKKMLTRSKTLNEINAKSKGIVAAGAGLAAVLE